MGYSYASFEAWELARAGEISESLMNSVDGNLTVENIVSADVLDSLSKATEQVIRDDVASGQLEPKDGIWLLLGLSLLIILFIYGTSKGSGGNVSETGLTHLDVYDPIVRYTAGIQGPFSPAELVRLNDYLAVQAWEENLALSPIGRL